MKRFIVLCVAIFVMASLSLRAENYDYGIGSATKNQKNKLIYSEQDIEQLKDLIERMQSIKTTYTEKDVEELARAGAPAIRAILVPIINLFGILESILQTTSTTPSAENQNSGGASPFGSIIYQLINPAIRLATGREVINIDAEEI